MGTAGGEMDPEQELVTRLDSLGPDDLEGRRKVREKPQQCSCGEPFLTYVCDNCVFHDLRLKAVAETKIKHVDI